MPVMPVTTGLCGSSGEEFPLREGHPSSSTRLTRTPAAKYGGHSETGELLGRLVADEFAADGFFDGITALVPVPLARQRERERGYNQSVEIARGISTATGIPVVGNVLERISFHGSQTQKSRWERNENVEKAFRLTDASAVRNRHVLLVDDVITTGATLVAAAREILKAGNVKVSVLSLGFANNE